MPNLNIYNIIILMGILQGFVFSFAILFTKKYYSKTNSFLAYTVLSLTFSNLQYWFLDSKLADYIHFFGILRIPCELLMIPMFYLFVKYYLEKEISKKQKMLLYLPFIVDLFFQIIISINTEIFYDKLIKYNIVYTYLFIEETFSMIFSSILIILTIRLVNKYERSNQNYNLKFVKAKTKWLKQILTIGLIVCSYWVLEIYFMMSKDSGMSVYYPLWICISFIIYWLSYVGLFQSSVLSQRKIIRKELINKIIIEESKENKEIENKNVNSKQQSHDKIFIEFEKLISKSYLNSNLSLEDIASELNISSNYLSQIIGNKNYKFNDYLNSVRIEKVKSMLKDDSFSNYTITSIGLEAGFNSNASFYRAFKKQTNKSPSDYREN